jgi:hypothetical protein
MWGDGGAGFAFGVRLGFGVGVGFAFGLGAIALGLVDLAVRGFVVLGVAALRLMDFLDVFRFAMSPPGVWLVVRVWGAVDHASSGGVHEKVQDLLQAHKVRLGTDEKPRRCYPVTFKAQDCRSIAPSGWVSMNDTICRHHCKN